MSLDLSAIVEAVAEAMWDRKNAPRTWAEDATLDEAIPALAQVRAFVSHAAPLIEAAVWNAAADFVDAQRDEEFGDDLRQVRDRLRSIARGESA